MPLRRAAFASCGLLLAATLARAELSPDTRAKISADFPAWKPNPPEAGAQSESKPAGEPAPLSDDPLVRLPEYRVNESPLARAGDKMLSPRQVQQKAMAAYQDSMTDLEWAMNCFYLPLFSAPPSARARAYYEEKKAADEAKRLSRLQTISSP